MNTFAPAPTEVKSIIIDLDIVTTPDDADDLDDDPAYIAHLEAEHAADAAADFATEHGFWPC